MPFFSQNVGYIWLYRLVVVQGRHAVPAAIMVHDAGAQRSTRWPRSRRGHSMGAVEAHVEDDPTRTSPEPKRNNAGMPGGTRCGGAYDAYEADLSWAGRHLTHQAAIEAGRCLKTQYGIDEPELVAAPDIVEHHGIGAIRRILGVIAWENNVEGYVMPNLDALIDAHDAAGLARVGINVSFDAFVTPGTSQIGIDGASVSAHRTGSRSANGSSNGIVCTPHRLRRMRPRAVTSSRAMWSRSAYLRRSVRVGNPRGHVEDFDGAHTDFSSSHRVVTCWTTWPARANANSKL